MKQRIGLFISAVACLLIAACGTHGAPTHPLPIPNPPPTTTEPTPLPSANPSPQPEALSVESILIFTPPSELKIYKELSRPNYMVWMGPRGWMVTATVTPWPANKRTIAAVAHPTSDPRRTEEISVQGSRDRYKGLITWFADGTGAGTSEEWDLTVGGEKGFLTVACSGGNPERLKSMCHDLLTGVQVSDLGAPVP